MNQTGSTSAYAYFGTSEAYLIVALHKFIHNSFVAGQIYYLRASITFLVCFLFDCSGVKVLKSITNNWWDHHDWKELAYVLINELCW